MAIIWACKVFRKHLARYIEDAPLASPPQRRVAKAHLCALDDPSAVERGLIALWRANESDSALAA